MDRDTEIKTNRAVKELSKKPFLFSKKFLYSLDFKDLEDLYRNTFNKPLERKSRIERRKNITGKIYIISNFENTICKIGFSKNPKERLKELQTGCPFKLDILVTFDGNIPTEKELHKKYAEYNMYGEWFCIKVDLKSTIEKHLNKSI